MKARDVLAVLFFVLTIYSFAGGTLLGAVNYPTWRSLNPAEFPRLHQAVNRPITLFYVPFFSCVWCSTSYWSGFIHLPCPRSGLPSPRF